MRAKTPGTGPCQALPIRDSPARLPVQPPAEASKGRLIPENAALARDRPPGNSVGGEFCGFVPHATAPGGIPG
jgi:hypothetical protein